MWVYGDRSRRLDVSSSLARLRSIGDFFLAAELAQGLVDDEFEKTGVDDLTPLHAAAIALVRSCVRGQACCMPLEALDLPRAVEAREPEGYAFYALYPEAYRRAALDRDWPQAPFVIGLRSIGLGLAAVVAEALDAREVVSLRPVGHPFQRRPRISDSLAGAMSGHPGPFVVVDEGPGLSGSSFGGVADLLQDLGVEPQRVVFMPGHSGPLGPQASGRHSARWGAAERLTVTLDDLLNDGPIDRWFEDLVGPAQRVEDLSGGAWARGPAPSWPSRERRKFRLTTPDGRFMARFAGLGAIGEAKLAVANALHEAGFTPEPVALRRGFLLERWAEGQPLELYADRTAVLTHLGRYLAFRKTLPPPATGGADIDQLCAMAAANAAALGGEGLRRQVEAGLADAAELSLRAVWTDGRLQPWEWVRQADGGFCKTDGLDHACAHDLVGAQDVVWDVAGAASEFDLTRAEVVGLCAQTGTDARTLRVMQVCYDAFHGAFWSMAADAAADPRSMAAARRQRSRHLARLQRGRSPDA